MTSRSSTWLFGASVIALTGAMPAYAQEPQTDVDSNATAADSNATAADQAPAAPTGQTGASAGDIVVTGSRIVRGGFTTPTPVTAVSAEQLQTAAPTTIAAGLNQLPQFRSSSRPESAQQSANAAAGANYLNLRNLGPNRVLVLLDGRRIVPSNITYAADINSLPESLIRQVDVVTGGASATYGSDAVAGVVNFILDSKFTGVKSSLQMGITDIGDSPSGKATLAIGSAIGDRLHFIGSVEVYARDGLSLRELDRRPWSARNAAIVSVPGRTPLRTIEPDNAFLSLATYGGLINSGPLRGTAFGDAAANPLDTPTAPFAFGTIPSPGNNFQIGGIGGARQSVSLAATLKRAATFGRLTWETDGPTFSLDLGYSRSDTKQDQFAQGTYGTTGFTIFTDNPFIPSAVRAQLPAGTTSFGFGRVFEDLPLSRFKNTTEVLRAALAARGDVMGDWRYDVYYTYGHSKTRVVGYDVFNYNRLFRAVDVVADPRPGATFGQPICRALLGVNPDPNCVPLNPFGIRSVSPAAAEYALGDQIRVVNATQHVGSVNLSGPLFTLAASSPVAMAFGAEIRRETARQRVNAETLELVDVPTRARNGVTFIPSAVPPNGTIGPFVIGNSKPFTGALTVKEAYAEIDVPIVSDMTMIDLLTLNASARYTDYSTSGGIWSWKVGGDYKPFPSLRFRATRSRDIRAANPVELNQGAIQTITQINDITGAQRASTNLSSGNPDLEPERADTLTAGVVFEPSFIPGLSLSGDYYRIKIKDAISSLTAQVTYDECFRRNNPVQCANITNVGTAAVPVFRTLLPLQNLNSLLVSGIDLEASYRRPVGEGRLTLRALANYQGKFTTTAPGSVPVNRAGEIGTTANVAQPKWQATASARYDINRFAAFVQGRYIGSGKQNVTFVEGVDIDDNSIPAVVYVDLTLEQGADLAGVDTTFFVTVNNLFNKAPPLVPIQSGNSVFNTNAAIYDIFGRYITVGARAKF